MWCSLLSLVSNIGRVPTNCFVVVRHSAVSSVKTIGLNCSVKILRLLLIIAAEELSITNGIPSVIMKMDGHN